ncbi:MAG: PH domain-containing protein [Kangiellaceae bacterium]|nr:PH domain-containing protein [Kangiellaceae bacterium]
MSNPQSTIPNVEQSSSKFGEESTLAINFQSLSRHYPKVHAFSSFIGWAIILVIMLVVDTLVDKVNIPYFVLLGIALLALLSGLMGYFSAKACGYFQDEFDIYFKQGLWWRKQTALNFSRIQHIDISHGPLERRYQMATIKFFTAGGAMSDLKISGLPSERAETLRQDILRYAKENYEQEVQSGTAESVEVANTLNSSEEVANDETRKSDD